MRQFTNVNYYAILGVTSGATRDEIRAAYRSKVRVAHPDRGGDPEEFAKVAEAWEVLGNESERTIYDADLKLRLRVARPYNTTRLPREDLRDADDADPSARFHKGRTTTTTDAVDARTQWMQNKRRL